MVLGTSIVSISVENIKPLILNRIFANANADIDETRTPTIVDGR